MPLIWSPQQIKADEPIGQTGLDMEIAKQPLFAMISQRLGWLTERQRVLSENVANADTPDYRPRDLKELKFEQMLRGASHSIPVARTDGKHFSPNAQRNGLGPGDMSSEKPHETTLSGNAVTLDVELMKISQTAHDHQLASGLYRKHLNLFRAVLGRPGS